jgi:flagellar basal body-associated protein FliL
MTTKKVIFIIVGVILALVLLIAVFVGAIVGFAFYSFGHNEAAETARDFLRKNEKLKKETGEIKEFGTFVTGNVNVNNADGQAAINLKVIGERKTLNSVTVELMYKSGKAWHVTGASYVDEAGKTVNLLDPFGKPAEESP